MVSQAPLLQMMLRREKLIDHLQLFLLHIRPWTVVSGPLGGGLGQMHPEYQVFLFGLNQPSQDRHDFIAKQTTDGVLCWFLFWFLACIQVAVSFGVEK